MEPKDILWEMFVKTGDVNCYRLYKKVLDKKNGRKN